MTHHQNDMNQQDITGQDIAGFKVVVFDTLTSTQDVARAAIQAHLDHAPMPEGMPKLTGNTVIRAAEQQSGRGRRARDWRSPLGGSYQTLLFAPPLVNKSAVSLWVALGMARALSKLSDTQADSRVMVKWPNDLFMDDKKVAGILCEWCRGWLLVGIGVNVDNPVPATATRLEQPLEQVHASVLAGAAAGVQDWQRGTPLAPAFADWDFLQTKQVTLQTARGTVTGVARGVDEQGCLQLDIPCCDGHVVRWSAD